MRLIYLHQYFTTPQMPGGTRSYEMARRMVARGHEVHMVTADASGRGRGWRETEEAGIHVHWCPVPNLRDRVYGRRLRAFLGFAWAAARKAAALPGDVVFATSTPLTIALPAVYAARRKGLPMVFEVRDLWPEMPIAMGVLRGRLPIAAARWLERFAYRHAAHVIALAPGMKEGIAATGCPEERITVVPNACDLERFRVPAQCGHEFRRRRAWLEDRPLVVYAGALGVANGVDYLARLAAATLPRDPEVRFLVVGSDREEKNLRATAKRLGVLGVNLFIEPAVAKAEMPVLVSAADLCTCLLLNVKELWTNSPNKLFDALAAGRPIAVNSRHGWAAEMIRQTGCGLVLDPEDLAQAAQDLVAALRDECWHRRARAAAAHLAETRFDRERLFAVWEEVLLRFAPQEALRKAA